MSAFSTTLKTSPIKQAKFGSFGSQPGLTHSDQASVILSSLVPTLGWSISTADVDFRACLAHVPVGSDVWLTAT